MPITARENKKPGVSSGNNPSPVKEGLLIRILWYSPAREETTARESEGHEQAFPPPRYHTLPWYANLSKLHLALLPDNT